MDPKGPPEGGPGDTFDMFNIGKVADTSVTWPIDNPINSAIFEQPKKMNNNRLLFLTVSKI